MIKVNGYIIKTESFPQGEIKISNFDTFFSANKTSDISIEWFWSGENSEMVELYFIVKHLKEIKRSSTMYVLYLPYIPYARQDRVYDSQAEVFTLKYFTEFINSLEFDRVEVLDPHSDVSTALIKNCTVDRKFVADVIEGLLGNEYDALFMPDLGAQKRYSSLVSYPNFTGYKDRDYETGEITSYKILGYKKEYKKILIVDDICSYGGTFLQAAKALKKKGVENIDLYVTHCERSVYKGEMLYSGLIDNIYTTNSIMPMEPIVCKEGAKFVAPIHIGELSYVKAN